MVKKWLIDQNDLKENKEKVRNLEQKVQDLEKRSKLDLFAAKTTQKELKDKIKKTIKLNKIRLE